MINNSYFFKESIGTIHRSGEIVSRKVFTVKYYHHYFDSLLQILRSYFLLLASRSLRTVPVLITVLYFYDTCTETNYCGLVIYTFSAAKTCVVVTSKATFLLVTRGSVRA